uniref:Uncharacterized protein MANES_07G019200 n=1 Tax=Rhizophora mucronata TaxID=61149 RepID=A0A2P2IZ42_RHIMU
MHSICLCLLDP